MSQKQLWMIVNQIFPGKLTKSLIFTKNLGLQCSKLSWAVVEQTLSGNLTKQLKSCHDCLLHEHVRWIILRFSELHFSRKTNQKTITYFPNNTTYFSEMFTFNNSKHVFAEKPSKYTTQISNLWLTMNMKIIFQKVNFQKNASKKEFFKHFCSLYH